MADPILVIGNKNYSSWSLRPWIAMKVLGIPFVERRIALYTPGAKEQILRDSPSGKVPCLVHGNLRVWDSLAILETLAEMRPELWPGEPARRATARSACAEMHAGFAALRQHMSMNVRRRYPGKGRTPEVLADIARIVAVWSECLAAAGESARRGPFLFGAFTAADAMYAPIVLRFRTYEVELPAICRAYADAMLELPAMQEWIAAAERETESIARFDLYEPAS